jgi:hypothetical protein
MRRVVLIAVYWEEEKVLKCEADSLRKSTVLGIYTFGCNSGS